MGWMDCIRSCSLIMCGLLLVIRRVNGQVGTILVEDNGEQVEIDGFVSTSSEFEFSTSLEYELYYPSTVEEQFACRTPITPLPSNDNLKALILLRASCSFEEKVLRGSIAGADVVIIANSEAHFFNSSEGLLLDPCSVDCSISSSSESAASCEESSSCSSGYCLLNAVDDSQLATSSYCCVLDPLQDTFFQNETIDIGVIYVSVKDGEVLISKANSSSKVKFQTKDTPIEFPPSALILLTLGTLVTIGASYRATRFERLMIFDFWGQMKIFPTKSKEEKLESPAVVPTNSNSDEEERPLPENTSDLRPVPDSQLDQIELTISMGICFLLVSTASLVGLFFLFKQYPTEGVIAIIVIYGLGAIFATAYFFVHPVLTLVLPKRFTSYSFELGKRGQECFETENLSIGAILSAIITITMVVIWFVYRHSDWAWILQNVFSAALACIFLVTIRISSLQISTYILIGFFIYDIFMVFITPFFGGESVMLEVATAGEGSISVSSDNLFCVREPDERLPMLFIIPREGGFALLGLGDILLPGIFIVYVLRVDYLNLKFSKYDPADGFSLVRFIRAHTYYIPVCAAYFVGLFLAFLFNVFEISINGVQGQPALLYIIPCVVGTFMLQACYRKQFYFFWKLSLTDIEHRAVRAS